MAARFDQVLSFTCEYVRCIISHESRLCPVREDALIIECFTTSVWHVRRPRYNSVAVIQIWQCMECTDLCGTLCSGDVPLELSGGAAIVYVFSIVVGIAMCQILHFRAKRMSTIEVKRHGYKYIGCGR